MATAAMKLVNILNILLTTAILTQNVAFSIPEPGPDSPWMQQVDQWSPRFQQNVGLATIASQGNPLLHRPVVQSRRNGRLQRSDNEQIINRTNTAADQTSRSTDKNVVRPSVSNQREEANAAFDSSNNNQYNTMTGSNKGHPRQQPSLREFPREGPRRTSEKKCEEYGQAIGRTVWALPLVGTRPEAFSASNGSNGCATGHTPLIVGGTNAQPGEFPHMAALGWSTDDGNIDYFCGGTLISERWVITAAHCTHGPSGGPTVVRVGAQRLSDKSGQVISIKRVQIHPSYKAPAMYSDIALLELQKPVTFGNRIRPACLYQEYDIAPTLVWVTGWGVVEVGEDRSDVLLKARLDVVDNVICALRHNRSSAVPRGVVPSMVCAGDPRGGWNKDTCQGDSGGPMQVIHPTTSCLYQLVGITSFGKLCALRDSPGVYTRVSHYLDWIENIVWSGENQ